MSKLNRIFIALALWCLSVGMVNAQDIIDNGTCGTDLTWELTNNGILTISGTGEMDNFLFNQSPWYSYKSAITEVIIDNGVTSIGDYAFHDCSSLIYIDIAEVTSIGEFTFSGTSFSSLTIPEGIKYIGPYAFAENTSLHTVNYNAINCTAGWEEEEWFDADWFLGCRAFTTLKIGENVTTIWQSAFRNCTSLITIDLSNAGSLTTIGDRAFYNCTSLASIDFSNARSLKSIGYYAFENTGLTSVTIPENITIIRRGAFGSCKNLVTVNYNAINCTNITNYTGWFYNCSALNTLNIGENVTTIGQAAFRDCTSLTTIDFTNAKSLISIGDLAFSNCTSLTTIDFSVSGSLKSIGSYAFENSGIAGNFIIPASVETIGGGAFWGTAFSSLTIPEGVEHIGGYAFAENTSLHTVNYNAINCTNIEDDEPWFPNCSAFTTLNIGENVTTIGDWVFQYSALTNVDLSNAESLSTIGDYAFSNCTSLTTIDFSNARSLTSIGDCAFENTGLTSVTIPENITKIGGGAFRNCKNLVTVNYNAINVESGGSAFANCSSFATLTIGEGLTTIPEYFFGNFSGLSSVVIPEGVTKIERSAFYNCTNLTTLELPSTLTEIGYEAFYLSANITKITTRAVTPPTIGLSTFGDHMSSVLADAVVYVPCFTYDLYNNSEWTYHFNSFIVDGLVSPDTTYYYATKCYEKLYSDQNFTDIYDTGKHYKTLENQNGCDSVVCLILSEYDYVQPYNYFATICKGSSYTDENFTGLTTAGRHSRTWLNVNNCDSIVNLELSFAVSPEQKLCMISVDRAYHNQVVWKRQEEIVSYNIYRESNTAGQYEMVATIPYDEDNNWIDMESNAQIRSYKYRVSGIDTCGNESELSFLHKTMHLTINQGVGNSWNLIWTPYEGIGYSTYNIYRAVGETLGELELIYTMSSGITSYTDMLSTNTTYVYYMVEIVLDEDCEVSSAAKFKSKSSDSTSGSIRSNIATNNPDGVTTGLENINTKNSIQIYPNPVRNELFINHNGLTINQVEIIDLSGKTMLRFNDSKNQFNVSALPKGTYFIKIETENGTVVEKIIKE